MKLPSEGLAIVPDFYKLYLLEADSFYMETCCKCKENLPLENFNRNKARKSGYANICRPCMKLYKREYYTKNKNKLAKEIYSRRSTMKKVAVQNLLEYFENKSCADCENKDPRVLEFDHLQNKKYSISSMVCGGYKWESIIKEIEKCEVVCSNCHKIRTSERGNFFRSDWADLQM